MIAVKKLWVRDALGEDIDVPGLAPGPGDDSGTKPAAAGSSDGHPVRR